MKKSAAIIGALLVAAAICLNACAGTRPVVTVVEGEAAVALSVKPSVTIIDVRTAAEFASGHLPNAVNIDFLETTFETKVQLLGKSKKYLVYCKSGNRSGKAVAAMQALGFQHLYNLSGGISGWKGSIVQ